MLESDDETIPVGSVGAQDGADDLAQVFQPQEEDRKWSVQAAENLRCVNQKALPIRKLGLLRVSMAILI